MRSCSPSPLSHTHAHTRYQTVCIRSKSVLPPLSSPATPSALCSLGCKHYPSNGSLEDTKTSSYLTPDTNLRALTVVYLGIKRRHPNIQGYLSSLQQEQAIQGEDRQSHLAINPPQHTLCIPPHPLSLAFHSPPTKKKPLPLPHADTHQRGQVRVRLYLCTPARLQRCVLTNRPVSIFVHA